MLLAIVTTKAVYCEKPFYLESMSGNDIMRYGQNDVQVLSSGTSQSWQNDGMDSPRRPRRRHEIKAYPF